MADHRALPGAELVDRGLADLIAGRESEAALLVAIAAPRLRRQGLPVPADAPDDAELRLYRLLGRTSDDAYGRYNALLREIVSFARALEREEGARIRAGR